VVEPAGEEAQVASPSVASLSRGRFGEAEGDEAREAQGSAWRSMGPADAEPRSHDGAEEPDQDPRELRRLEAAMTREASASRPSARSES
jgi:hypothetical protein